MLQARNIGESQIELLGIVLFRKFQYFLRTHPSSRWALCMGLSRAGISITKPANQSNH